MRTLTTLLRFSKSYTPTISTGLSTTRFFSSSSIPQLRSTELSEDDLKSLQANSSRLWALIHETAQWGANNRYGSKPEQTGLSRLTLSEHDKSVRDWFVKTAESLSCKTYVDQIGNIFAIRPGLTNDAAPTYAGSHLDSQPMGGRFDGVLGVAAGIEMLKVLEENHIETEGPVGVVNWTNEEGARFSVSMMGSGVWAGAQDLKKMYQLKDVSVPAGEAKMLKDELERIGYLGDVPASWDNGKKIGAYLELHIEQGPYLERAGQKIGVVEGVQAYKWLEVIVHGRACHTGTTGFDDRADALYWASRAISEVRNIAEKAGGLGSVGIIRSEPQSINTVPDKVFFTIDIRHRQDKGVQEMLQNIDTYLTNLQKEANDNSSFSLTIDWRETFDSVATQFNSDVTDAIEASAESLVGKNKLRRMHSGAGHDAVNTSKRAPTAMIFVPCNHGVSHHPEEWSTQEDVTLGTSVLTQSVLRFDKLRYKQGHFAERRTGKSI